MKLKLAMLLALAAPFVLADQQHIDFGTASPNDGDTAPVAFQKIEDNFNENYASIASLEADLASLTADLAATDLLVATKQDADADLTTIAGLSPSNDDVLQRKAGAWVNRTLAQLRTDLALVIGTNVQAWDADLDAYASTANASTATALAANGTNCSPGDAARGVDAAGNAENCFTPSGGGGGAPTDATYITQTANASLSNEQAMGALATGIVKNTATTGVQSIAVAGTDYVEPAGNVATATALAANGTNCSAGQYALGVDASGNAESCTADSVGGDASTNTSTSVDGEVALFSSTGGKTLKRATGSGLAKLTSGVLSTATAGTDYQAAIAASTWSARGSGSTVGELKRITDVGAAPGALMWWDGTYWRVLARVYLAFDTTLSSGTAGTSIEAQQLIHGT